MTIVETGVEGLLIIEPRVFADDRGYFYESYNKDTFAKLGLHMNFVQDNESLSQRGVLRGLHFQKNPHAQGKLVRVIKGAVLDVVVDIRSNSSTYGKIVQVELTEENKRMFWVPVGFAHGFATLKDNTIFSYKCTNVYHKEAEGGILWNDADLSIDWGVSNPLLSDKDKLLSLWKDFRSPF